MIIKPQVWVDFTEFDTLTNTAFGYAEVKLNADTSKWEIFLYTPDIITGVPTLKLVQNFALTKDAAKADVPAYVRKETIRFLQLYFTNLPAISY